MLLKYLNNRVLAILSGVAIALGILALVLIFGFEFGCHPEVAKGVRTCSAGTSGIFGSALLLPYVILAAISSVLALVKAGVTRQYIWFAVIFLFSIFLLGPFAVLPFSLLTPNDRKQTIAGLHEPENKDLRDFRSPRPA